jgi:hypothetical protein
VRHQTRLNDRSCSRRSRSQLHVRIATLDGARPERLHQHSRRAHRLSQWARSHSGRLHRLDGALPTYAQRLLLQPARSRAAAREDCRYRRRHVLNGCISTVGEFTASASGRGPTQAEARGDCTDLDGALPKSAQDGACGRRRARPAARESRRSRRLQAENGASAQSAGSPHQPVGADPLGAVTPSGRCEAKVDSMIAPAAGAAPRAAALGAVTPSGRCVPKVGSTIAPSAGAEPLAAAPGGLCAALSVAGSRTAASGWFAISVTGDTRGSSAVGASRNAVGGGLDPSTC